MQKGSMKNLQNLRVKMMLVIVVTVLLCIGLMLLFSYQRARSSMSAQLEANYSVVADKYAQELAAWINTKATILDTMAAEITSGEIYDGDPAVFHKYLADCHELLNEGGAVYDFYFTYPDNNMVCASDFVSDGSVDYVHEREWYTRAAGTGELYYSTPYLDSDSGKPIITISRAVFRDNRVRGVLAADIFVDVLVDIISRADVAPDSYAFLVDQQFGMIVHPNDAYNFDDVPLGVMDVPDAPYGEVLSKIRSGSGETVYLTDYDGVTRGVAVSRMPNTGWYVGIATSKAELMKGLHSLVRGFLIAAGAAVAVGGCIAAFLAYTLNKMNLQRESYEARVQDLEKQVSDRTARVKRSSLPEAAEKDADSGSAPADRDVPRKQHLRGATILIILLLMICMVAYTSHVIQQVAVTNIREVGEDRISAVSAQLENYLETTKTALWITADTADYMAHSGAPNEEILQYIIAESDNQAGFFDENFLAYYGYVQGEYLDGLLWVPPENYDPTQRDWYRSAIAARGEIAVIPPYVDAQTGEVIISISRRLSGEADVLSLDVKMNHIQELVSELQIKERGYGFIVDRDGLFIAHRDEAKKGTYLTDDEQQLELMDKIHEVQNGNFEVTIGGQRNTVFVRPIIDQWYAVIVISRSELFAEVTQQLFINVLICSILFALISFFFFLGHRNEQNYTRRIEEMRVEEQRQAFEARALKLEKEAADQANKSKSDFLAEMSHEIRTPINAVLGMNEMILRESLPAQSAGGARPEDDSRAFAKISTYAGNIENAGRNLLAIINDILDFSKIESGKMEITEGRYRLSSMLNDLSNMVFFKTTEKGLDFIVDVDESLPDGLYGDEGRVRQIITNLLSNAVKYTEQGSVKLSMRGEVQGEPKPGGAILLKVAVRDTGIGIQREDIDKLFTKFQRLDLKRTGTVEGTGLGLAITSSLLDLMGGSIEVESEYGKGSVFTITVPQKIVSLEPVGNFQARFRKHAQEAEAYRAVFQAPDAHILIVDDTKMNLTVAVGLLKDTLMHIDTAGSGEKAVVLAREKRYDLILMDQRMPKMDGTEALRLIRSDADGANRETPIICLTADAVIGARERYMAEGFTDYLTKPIDSHALEELLLRYLPGDKVACVRPYGHGEEEKTPNVPADDRYAPLRRAGIDPEAGLNYCQRDEALYRTVLLQYAFDMQAKSDALKSAFEARDWTNYSVLVHSLKSSSRMIGAQDLSAAAEKLEKAADGAYAGGLLSEHEQLLLRWNDTVQAIRQSFDGAKAGGGSAQEDEEILEFLPED